MLKIKVTNNKYQEKCKEAVNKLYNKVNPITSKELDIIMDQYEIIPFKTGDKIIDKIVNSYCHTKEEGNGITTYRGHMGNRYAMYELIDTIEVSGKKINDDGYNITIYSNKLMAIITYCEGDFIVEVCKTKEVYKDRKDYTKKWYKENY